MVQIPSPQPNVVIAQSGRALHEQERQVTETLSIVDYEQSGNRVSFSSVKDVGSNPTYSHNLLLAIKLSLREQDMLLPV